MGQRVIDLLKKEASDEIVTAQGWVKTKRESKTVFFLELSDGSTLKGLQVVIELKNFNDLTTINNISTGSAIEVEGKLVPSVGTDQNVELFADKVTLIGESPAETYPLQKKRHTFEFLREIAHLRARTNTIGAVARVRHALSFAIHSYFNSQGFYYVHTPIISTSDAEGAGEQFLVTTLDLNSVAKDQDNKVDWQADFFGRRATLTVSGQLQGEAYASALKNIYTFGPTFRAEHSNTKRHLSEFWMVEPEVAFCDLEGNMALAEDFLKSIFKYVLQNCQEDMAFFSHWIEKGVDKTLQSVIEKPFVHITYTDAVAELIKNNKSFDYPVKWGTDLQTEHERYLTEVVFDGPVIVTDYPKEIKAFYMKLNEDGKTVKAMDVLVPRLGEIIGGSERENRLSVLEEKIAAAKLDPKEYWWYLDLRRYGSVPHSGFGLGFDRAVQYVTGMQNIRDVIPFPRSVNNAEF
ncbi:MAG: asparagine--tRNA ligase [Sphaerochaetaceae bacterium]